MTKNEQRYNKTLSFSATEVSLLWKAVQLAKKKYERLIKKQEMRKKQGKLEPGEGVPYDVLEIYRPLVGRLQDLAIAVEDEVLSDIKALRK